MSQIYFFPIINFQQVYSAVTHDTLLTITKNRKAPFIKNKYRDENVKEDSPFIEGIKEATGRDLKGCYSNYRILWKNNEDIPKGGRCLNCCTDFNNIISSRPVKKEVLSEMNENNKENIITVYYCEEIYCSDECCLFWIMSRIRGCSSDLEPDLIESCSLLKELHYLRTGEDLKCSQDPRLLDINGGSLTRSEWLEKSGIYQRTKKRIYFPPNIIIRPSRTIYTK